MEQPVVPLSETHISKLNMRHGRKKPFIGDILPSIRKRGVHQPLLVRKEGDRWGVVAGRRRWFCLQEIAREQDNEVMVPCTIMDDGDDDTAALEASIIENAARLDPDQIEQFNAFKALADAGAEIADIAETFGVTERLVNQRLAIARLLPAIKKLYTEEDIQGSTLTALTLASKAQQKEWLAMYESEECQAPLGSRCKAWILGGQAISTEVALFDVETFDGQVYQDLFGENAVFADADAFWVAQNNAIADLREDYLAKGWSKVTLLEPGAFFNSWEYEAAKKSDGGEVIIETHHSGKVSVYTGITKKRSLTPAKSGKTAQKQELSGPLENYLDRHRHAAVRAALLGHQTVALRLLVAHLIVGSDLIRAEPDPERTLKDETQESVGSSPAQHTFEKERAEIADLLDMREDEPITGGNRDGWQVCQLFAKCLTLDDDQITRILTFIMAESLGLGHAATDMMGEYLKVDMADNWSPDEAFLSLLRDKQVISTLLNEVAGKKVADANSTATGKVQKKILTDTLRGADGRKAKEGWLPRWLQFPAKAYLADRHCRLAVRSKSLKGIIGEAEAA